MLRIRCPVCGMMADETELHAGGEAHLVRAGTESTDAEFEAYMFLRTNTHGVNFERWLHQYGCGKWFHVVRDSTTHQVFGTYGAQTLAPPADILKTIAAATGQADAAGNAD